MDINFKLVNYDDKNEFFYIYSSIAERLDISYLKVCDDNLSNDSIEGILYGTNRRPMLNLVVSSRRFKKPINVIFLVDTRSPCLYTDDL
jgi:hypothetical protein